MRYADLIKGFLLVALLPAMAACGNEDEVLPQDGDKQAVQVNITRAAMDGNEWAWKDGDAVKLRLTPNGGAATEYTLTYNNNVWNASPDFKEMMLPAKAEAWWPASASTSSFTYSYNNGKKQIYTPGWNSVPFTSYGTVDQSTEEKLAQSDWMTTDVTSIGTTANLTMKHRLCKVTVNIVGYSGWDKGEPQIKEARFYTVYENIINSISSDLKYLEVNPLLKSANSKQTYTAIVSAWKYDDGGVASMTTPLIRFQTDDGTDLFASYSGEQLQSGNAYTFNLTVKNPKATTRSSSSPKCELELVDVQDMNNSYDPCKGQKTSHAWVVK